MGVTKTTPFWPMEVVRVLPPRQTGLGVTEPTKCGFKFNRDQKPVIIFQVFAEKVMNLQLPNKIRDVNTNSLAASGRKV